MSKPFMTGSECRERWVPRARDFLKVFTPAIQKGEKNAVEVLTNHLAMLLSEVHGAGRAEKTRELREMLNEGFDPEDEEFRKAAKAFRRG